jgi:hypothetical protein
MKNHRHCKRAVGRVRQGILCRRVCLTGRIFVAFPFITRHCCPALMPSETLPSETRSETLPSETRSETLSSETPSETHVLARVIAGTFLWPLGGIRMGFSVYRFQCKQYSFQCKPFLNYPLL